MFFFVAVGFILLRCCVLLSGEW